MLVREAIQSRLMEGARQDPEAVHVRLPLSLKSDRVNVRTGMFQRLASSRAFALGDRSGVLRAAQGRSGRAFRLDVRQRVVVKALVSRHVGKGAERAAALGKHVAYLGRSGAGVEGGRPEFFDRDRDGVRPAVETEGWSRDRHHFRFIISPEHGDRIGDLRGYVRDVMARVAADLGQPDLKWLATCHYDTDQPHAHVLVRGRRGDGRDLVIPRDYMGYGFRARAQEAAQERLGDLSRVEAERRIWRETQADRFTSFDRRLLAAADGGGLVDDRVGASDAWAALTRGRLRHLEGLGLAARAGRRYRLAGDMETKLRTLQARRDIIRTLNQRRLEGARDVRPLGTERVRGVVVKSGYHDEAGAAPFVVVRDAGGVEHYARLCAGEAAKVGTRIALAPISNGLAQVLAGRTDELAR
ncbi:MAG: relaxase/mobilization nuclease domain-containing protein [Caulobacterales bacterium]|nr:relaxase/mobilization nuclease domain-containing protein [Caulobacterales bacterium]